MDRKLKLLWDAVRRGDLAEVRRLLEQGVELNSEISFLSEAV